MGLSGIPLGQQGCLVTATASLISDLTGKPITPGELNAWMGRHGGYLDGNHFLYYSIQPLGVIPVFFSYCERVAAPVDTLRSHLQKGNGVLVEVDSKPGGEIDEHWVRLIEFVGDDARVMDPWPMPDGDQSGNLCMLLERYTLRGWDLARAIFRAVVYVPVVKAA